MSPNRCNFSLCHPGFLTLFFQMVLLDVYWCPRGILVFLVSLCFLPPPKGCSNDPIEMTVCSVDILPSCSLARELTKNCPLSCPCAQQVWCLHGRNGCQRAPALLLPDQEQTRKRAALHQFFGWQWWLPGSYPEVLQLQWDPESFWSWFLAAALWKPNERFGPQRSWWIFQAR